MKHFCSKSYNARRTKPAKILLFNILTGAKIYNHTKPGNQEFSLRYCDGVIPNFSLNILVK